VRQVCVQVETLDSLLSCEGINAPALLKIDVQGAELDVLRGGAATVRAARPDVLIEVSFLELYEGQPTAHQLFEWLLDCGYGLERVGSVSTHRGLVVQADFLFSVVAGGRG
jgi:hypothetical protein